MIESKSYYIISIFVFVYYDFKSLTFVGFFFVIQKEGIVKIIVIYGFYYRIFEIFFFFKICVHQYNNKKKKLK
jgi:hypothetical protein